MEKRYCIAEVTLLNNSKETVLLSKADYELIRSRCNVLFESDSKREIKNKLKDFKH